MTRMNAVQAGAQGKVMGAKAKAKAKAAAKVNNAVDGATGKKKKKRQ